MPEPSTALLMLKVGLAALAVPLSRNKFRSCFMR
ncbi:MAG: hypothetical protein IPJ98_20945 [Bryobacterales bacterium]|nr:hypothetical protein [Bryobacterales bacterium]